MALGQYLKGCPALDAGVVRALAAGVPLNPLPNSSGAWGTALTLACSNASVSAGVVRALLDAGADPSEVPPPPPPPLTR